MKAKVTIRLKASVLDPQGQTIRQALETIGFQSVESVRCGKVMELSFKPELRREAVEAQLKDMCEKLLANPVIEDYQWEVESS